MSDEPKQPQQPKPKPIPILTDSNIEYAGEKGNYLFFAYALDQLKKPMSEIPILVFFGKETQPRFRLSSNSHIGIEFPVQFNSEKMTIGIKVGNLEKKTFELDGPEQTSSVSEEDKRKPWGQFVKERVSKNFKKWRSGK